MGYYGRRQSHAAGDSWRKWGDPGLDPRLPVKPWWAFKAGAAGLWLVLMSLGALLADLLR